MSAYEEQLPPEEQYTVGQIINDPSDTASPPPPSNIEDSDDLLRRHYPDNPFLGSTLRAQFVCNKHDAILKQFSSSQFRLPSVNHVMTPSTQQLVEHISHRLEAERADVHEQDSGSSVDTHNGTDVDDIGPLVFEFPYVSYFILSIYPFATLCDI